MGFTGHWVVAKGAGRVALRRLRLTPAKDEAAPGWRYAFGRGVPDDLDFDEFVARVARAGDGVAVGAWIFDSDYGQVVGVAAGTRAAVAIHGDVAEEPLEHDPEGFAAWSQAAPHPLTALEVHALASRDDVFAEETVDELLDRLGLPAPYDPHERPDGPVANLTITIGKGPRRDRPAKATRESVGATGFGGYVAPLGSMIDDAYVDPDHIPWRELRHVPGIGDDFLGIWDREAPHAPIATFPVSRRGEARLDDELRALQLPVRVAALNASALAGFVEPAEILSDIRVAGRDLSYRDTRYVLGRGDGFVGIWDRTLPDEPIERFRDDDHGTERAHERIHALLFEHELSNKATIGVRLYLPRSRSEIVKRDLPEPPRGMTRQMREVWEQMAEQGMYTQTSGAPWLIVEEDEDTRWRVVMDVVDSGPFHLYSVGGHGEELGCRGSFATVEAAQEFAARAELATGEWHVVPATVPRTLLATLRWAQRELVGAAEGPWYERFEWADEASLVEGARSFARVFEDGVATGVVLAAERAAGGDAAVYLVRPGDAPRRVYSLDRLDVLVGIVQTYLGDVDLGEWRALPDEWPPELGALAGAVLVLAGIG